MVNYIGTTPFSVSTDAPIPVAIVSGGGGGGGGATGSVTAAGTNGTTAQAVQGITGGVPVPVSGTFALAAGSAAIGSVSVSNLPSTQAVSGTVAVSALSGTVTVAGASAAGAAPTNPPLSVSGVDGSGNKQHLLVDTAGRQQVNVQPAAVSSMTTATVTTTSGQLLAARAGRRRMMVQVTGTGTVTLLYGTGTAVAGSGIVLGGAAASPGQGGYWEEPAHECWAGAVQAIASASTSVTIVEG